MIHKKKTREEVELIALKNLRGRKDRKLLNNTNVDCFIDGYMLAQDVILNRPYNIIEYLEDTIKGLNAKYKEIEDEAGYGGRYFTDGEIEARKLIQKVISCISSCIAEEKEKDNKKQFYED